MNYLYIGNMEDVALENARKMLGVQDIFSHPDFYMFGPVDKKKSMGVDVANEMLHIAETYPAKAEFYVYYIPHFEVMTVDAQNVLLKMLEENNYVRVIAVVDTDSKVLDTVKSRMKLIYYKPQTVTQYMAEGHNFYEYFADGVVERDLLRKVYDTLLKGSIPGILLALNMVKEKDAEEYAGSYKPILQLIRAMVVETIENRIFEVPGVLELPFGILELRNMRSVTEKYLAVADKMTKQDMFCYVTLLEN